MGWSWPQLCANKQHRATVATEMEGVMTTLVCGDGGGGSDADTGTIHNSNKNINKSSSGT